MLPGLWLMALSPLSLVLSPGVASAACWVTLMSVGEVIWSPRQSAWVASLAPEGREGIFLALLSLKSLITTIPSNAFNGLLNAAFNPNCEVCRDKLGHFCDTPSAVDNHATCVSPKIVCAGRGFSPALTAANLSSLHCPASCRECTGWKGEPRLMWLVVLLTSVSSPLMVACTLPYLRGVPRAVGAGRRNSGRRPPDLTK